MRDPSFTPNISRARQAAFVKKAAYMAFAAGLAVLTCLLLMRDIRVSLWPHAQFFRWFYGMDFAFAPGMGYVSPGAGVAITKGCMGAKLFVSMFLLLALGFAPRGSGKKLAAFTAKAYAGALAAAFLASLLRIGVSLPFAGLPNAQLIHNIISLVVYFGSMACLFLVMLNKSPGQQPDGPACANEEEINPNEQTQ